MARVLHFHAVEASRHHRLQPLAPAAVAWVGPDRQSPGLMGDADRNLYRQLCLRNERASAGAEEPREGVAEIVGGAARNHGACDVRPPDGATIRLAEYFIQRQLDAERIELLHDLDGTGISQCPQLTESLLQRIEPRQMQRQEMYFLIVLKRAELCAGDHADSVAGGGGTRRGNPVDRIVIRERDRGEATALGCFNDAFG